MAISVGSMSAGLGLDMSEFQSGMQRATEVARSNSAQMSASMKQSSREGAESLRLIDEAIGVHISRPLARIITQEFPGFASAMQSILGAGVAAGLGVAVYEGFEKISHGIQEARKAQEEWEAAAHASDVTFSDVMSSIQQKLAELRGQPAAIKFAIEGADEARRGIDAVSKALDREAEAAEKAQSLSTRIYSGIGGFFSDLAQGAALAIPDNLGGNAARQYLDQGAQVSNLRTSLQAMKESLDDALRTDKETGAHEALALIADDLKRVDVDLQAMRAAGNQAGVALVGNAQKFLQDSQAIETATQNLARAQTQKANQDAMDAAAVKVAGLYDQMQSSMLKLQPETGAFAKIGAEIDAMGLKANLAFTSIREQFEKGLIPEEVFARAESQLMTFTHTLELYRVQMQAAAEAEAFLKQAQTQGATLPGAQPFTAAAVPSVAPAPTVTPVLGAGGTAGAQFSTFASDQAAQLKAAAAAYEDIVTPAQKYSLAQAQLNLLLEKGLIDQDAYTAGLQKAEEQMAEASNKMAELQKKTNDASLGMQAFFQQMGAGANNNGTFTFDMLSKGLDGFESNTVQALTGGRTAWRKYFQELDQMALKFVLNKTLTQSLKSIFPGLFPSITPPAALAQGAGQPGAATPQTAMGALPNFLNLPKEAFGALPSVLNPSTSASQVSNTAERDSAGTTLTSAGTMLTSAAAALEAAASTLGSTAAANLGGAGGGGTAGFNPMSFTAFGGGLATGGDLTPGMSYMVGEQGPEPLTVDSSGGAFISPHSSLRDNSGGTTHIHNYDLRGADPAVVQRLVAALPMVEERAVARAVASSSEIARRTANP